MEKYLDSKTDKDDSKLFSILKVIIVFGILALIYMGISSNVNCEFIMPYIDLCINIFVCSVVIFFYTSLISSVICDCSFDKCYKMMLKQSGYSNSYFVPTDKRQELIKKSKNYANKVSKFMCIITLTLFIGMMIVSKCIASLRMLSIEITYIYVLYTLAISIICKLRNA